MTDKTIPEPDIKDGLPLCAEERCGQYDGKRCRLMGFRPDRFCEPALNEQSAKLARAMAVVDACIRYCDKEAFCPVCEGGVPAYKDEPAVPHDAVCPLVAHGFLTPSGERVK